MISASTILNASYADCGIIAENDTLEAPQAQDGLRRLNHLAASWRTQFGTVRAIDRQVFPLTANTQTYTIGTGGVFNVERPMTVTGAGLLLGTSIPPVEIPRAVITDDAFQAIRVKTLSSQLFTQVYYNPTFPLGTIFLWPNPNTAVNSLVLYLQNVFTGFADLTTLYDFPETPGYAEALQYALDLRLFTPYGVKDPAIIEPLSDLARQSLGLIKRANNRLTDLPTDAQVLTRNRRHAYNIATGEGG